MEFLIDNYFDSVGCVDPSTTGYTPWLKNPNLNYLWVSSGLNSDLTPEQVTISFASTVTIDRIALQQINLKDFSIFINGSTATTLAFTSTSSITDSSITGFSGTSCFFRLSTLTACTSVSFLCKTTQVANAEKQIGYIYIGAVSLDLGSQVGPDSSSYDMNIVRGGNTHRMADGGRKISSVCAKFEADIKLVYISQASRNSLFDLWNSSGNFIAPFGTATSWDGILFQFCWDSDFNGYSFQANPAGSGHPINMKLYQT
jgi:hypothetical protein